ncbi:hypothetical protein CRG98_039161, partial [Punica granatum]
MHEEKSQGGGLVSRKTRFKVTGRGTREETAAANWGKWGRHACSGHGTVQGQARWTPKRLGSLVIFALSRVGWLPEYRVVFRWFWPVSALAWGGRVDENGLEFER